MHGEKRYTATLGMTASSVLHDSECKVKSNAHLPCYPQSLR